MMSLVIISIITTVDNVGILMVDTVSWDKAKVLYMTTTYSHHPQDIPTKQLNPFSHKSAPHVPN